jgi:hypothetical protein
MRESLRESNKSHREESGSIHQLHPERPSLLDVERKVKEEELSQLILNKSSSIAAMDQ